MLKQKTPLKTYKTLKAKTPLKAKTQLKSYGTLKNKTPLKSNGYKLKTNKPFQSKTQLKTNKPLQVKEVKIKRTPLVQKPRKQVKRESIVFDDMHRCCLCGKVEDLAKGIVIHKHEIFFGSANRDKSIADKMIAPLCALCHENSNEAVHQNKTTDLKLKRIGQEVWEKNYIQENESSPEEARNAFIERFGKSWEE